MTSLSVAKVGEYSVKDIKTGKIKIANPGLNTIWMRYSLATAKIITTHNRLRIGWTGWYTKRNSKKETITVLL